MSLPIWVHVFRVVVGFALFLVSTALLIWAERRVVARMQSRIGPNRVGPFGIMQTLVDGVKLFFKEDVTPSMVDRPIYVLAPLLSVVVAFLSFAIIPYGGEVSLFGETFALQIADLNVGLLWFLAMGSINVYSVVLAGWSSRSPYPLLGGVRSSAQMVSYEIAQGLAVASVFVYAGTLTVSEIVAIQANEPGLIAGVPNWFVIPLFPAFLIFAVAMVAETQRPPFDLPEAEEELVAGFHTEYGGLRFAMFFLAEFMNVITVSAILVTMFFGGPAGPNPLDGTPALAWILPVVWFLAKTWAVVFVFILLRAALPRFKYDRLMDIGWKWLLPLGLVWVLATAFMVLVNEQLSDDARFAIAGGGIAAAVILYLVAPLFTSAPITTDTTPPSEEFGDELEEVST
ncbi:MAG: NADH-quinone oxidoreductase subunit NuoH [Actinobacteria bacterium]|nr:NADH-quinone oxidoreductase subunit NuoH [Actinomycetota bacterium]